MPGRSAIVKSQLFIVKFQNVRHYSAKLNGRMCNALLDVSCSITVLFGIKSLLEVSVASDEVGRVPSAASYLGPLLLIPLPVLN